MGLGPTTFLRTAVAFLALTVPAAAVPPPPPPPLVTNGDFETPTVAGQPELTEPTGWSTGTVGAKLVGAQTWTAASGVQSVELSSPTTETSVIHQPIAAVDGQRYDLSFSYAGNPIRDETTPACDGAHAVKSLDLRWDGWMLGQFAADTTGRTTADMGWKTAHVLVDGGASSVYLEFSANDGACGPVIDNVALSAPVAAQTSVRLYANWSGVVIGQPATLSASVIGSSAALMPTGTVQFELDGSPVGGPVAVVNGSAESSPLTLFQSGGHTETATYTPNTAAFDPSEASGPFYVGRAYTASTFTTPSPLSAGEPFDLSATVVSVAPGSGLPTGTLDIAAGGEWVGQSLPLDGSATAGVSMIAPAGPLDVAFIYSGDANYQDSSTYSGFSVARAGVGVALTASKSPVGLGETYTVDAVVAPANTNLFLPTGTVQFAVGGVKTGDPIRIGADGRASTSVTAPATATTQTVTATFSGDDQFHETVGRLRVSVRAPLPPRAVSPPPTVQAPSPVTPGLGPVFTFEASRSKLAKALRLGELVTVDCNSNCGARVLLRLSVKQARKLDIAARKPVVVGSGVRTAVDRSRYVVNAAFAAKYLARLAKARRLALEVRVTASNAAGRHAVASKTFTLKR
jgi:hypothetical protein